MIREAFRISHADKRDIAEILALQYLAYQTEAELLGNFDIPPLRQTLQETAEEFAHGVFLKAVDASGTIVGSVRAYGKDGTAYIGKLIVHPDSRRQGLGTALMAAIERACPAKRYELFTSHKSENNLRLYERLGYVRFAAREVSPGLTLIFLEKRQA